MDIREFYKKYNLNKYYFAEMAHVGVSTLRKYERGEKIQEKSRMRIENAVRVVVKNEYVRPKYKGGFDSMYNSYFLRITQEYKKHFEELLKEGA